MINDITNGLRVPSPIPLDTRLYSTTKNNLLNLGINNNLAYTYYKGMKVYCANERETWEWREELNNSEPRLLLNDFVYPNGLIINTIDYSNKSYNFFYVPKAEDIIIPPPISVPLKGITNVGNNGVTLYNGLTLVGEIAELSKINSNTLEITKTIDKTININLPSTFQGIDYYVNANYTGTEELGTASKPFKTLKNCIDKILNRPGSFQDPLINGGNAFNKWDLRPTLNGGAIRVIIQSVSSIDENIAINGVTYFLERGGFSSTIFIPKTGVAANLEYLLDMKELVDNIPKISGKLPYTISCAITGSGTIIFEDGHVNRKGFVRAYGHNDGTNIEQDDSVLTIGSVGGTLNFVMYKNPSLPYTTLYSDNANTIPIIRESTVMEGYQTTTVPTYGAFECKKANAQFRDSLFFNGEIQINCYEQHMLLFDDFGTAYGENGRIYFRRNYQKVNYSSIENININPFNPNIKKFYKPSEHIYDIYLKNGSSISYAGNFYGQENTAASQGGSEAFLCLENNTTDPLRMCGFGANGGGTIPNLFYNHLIKFILNPIFNDYQHHSITLKNLSLDSVVFNEVISLVDTLNNNWNKIVTVGRFIDTLLNDFFFGGIIRKPFSNMIINTNLFLIGTSINLGKGILKPNIPIYADNIAALADNYPIGGEYRDNLGNLKIVI